MRLIDADALIKSIEECVEAKDANCEWEQLQGLECALECIDEEPTVQPVVLCKDCIHSDIYPKDADNDMPLKCLSVRYGGVMPDWYCEHAERRTE